MAINFCLSQYSPRIRCDQVSADNFEVDNLISPNARLLKNGFRAESFIKPPVEIIVTFPLSIDISHIVLGLRNGTQQTKVVSLYTKFRKNSHDSMEWNFKCISKGVETNCSKVCFENLRYRQNKKFIGILKNAPAFTGLQDLDIRRIHPGMDTDVSCIYELKICLLKAANSGIVVLNKLEVWGQPARSCSVEWMNRILNSEKKSQKITKSTIPMNDNLVALQSTSEPVLHFPPPTSDVGAHLSLTAGGGSVPSVGARDVEHELTIPADFLDSITYEIMALPMALPSGNNIDQHTLEKCNQMQEFWGHIPIDPFTGIPFHGENQPIFNAALKFRIDEFLMKNHKTFNAPRTTGRMESSQRSWRKSNLCSAILPDSETNTCTFDTVPSSDTVKIVHNRKRSIADNDSETKKLRLNVDSSTHNGSFACREQTSSRKESLKKDIENVLGSLQCFTRFSDSTNEVAASKKCTVCDSDISEPMFQLPCSHVLCRNCLVTKLKINPALCNICNRAFSSRDASRVFI